MIFCVCELFSPCNLDPSEDSMKAMLIFLIALFLFSQMASAVSISPEILEQLIDSGELGSIVAADETARERGVWQPSSAPYRFGLATDIDTLHCLIILVDFSDMQHETRFNAQPEHFDTLLFSFGVRTPPSMADYYDETSYGQAYLIGQVTQWYRMPQLYSYYFDGQRGFGSYPRNAQRLTEDAVLAADRDIDFTQYDNNGDGYVDALFVVHAGPGYEDTGNLNYIHSHAWVTSYQMDIDGVLVYGYSMEPEETGSGNLVTIGVFCHEFGHVLGLPDLYDYDYDSQGVGGWSVMAGGSWGGGGAIPVHFDGWCRFQLGWAIPTTLVDNLSNEQIDAVEYSPDTYQLFSIGMPDPQYFLVENRRRELFDVSVPGDGLLIYHIDESQPNNNDQTRYKVAVEQADGEFNLEHNFGADNRDPWPGATDNRTFDDFSLPNAWLYDLGPSEVAVSNISDSDSVMFADLSIMYVDPLYRLLGIEIDDSSGNGNGRPDAGETCNLIFTAENIRAWVNNLIVTVSSSHQSVTFSDSTAIFGALPVNQPFDNSSDPVTFSVSSDLVPSFAYFSLRFTARGGLYEQLISERILLGQPNLLLVDDDNGMSIDTFYTAVLDSLNQAFELWDVYTQGSPTTLLSQYPYVIWFTGNTRPDTMSAENVACVTSYLNGGGHIIISSQDFVQQLSARWTTADSILLSEFLKVGYDRLEYDHHPEGEPGTVFDSLVFLTSGSGGANNQTSQDALFVLNGGIRMMNYRTARAAGVAAVSNYAALTLGFGAEAINGLFPAYYDDRYEFMVAALAWLTQPTSVLEPRDLLPTQVTLHQNYPNPFNPWTLISFELPSSLQVKLEIFDLLGRLVGTPVDAFMEAGDHTVEWDASEETSGIYMYRITAGSESVSRKMTLLR